MKIKVGLSTRPDVFIGDIETWNKAEKILKNIMGELYPDYEIYEKDGAFYFHKINCKVTDAFGRDHQLANYEMLHYNYIVVIGKKEVESDVINLRNPKMVLNFDDFVKFIQNQKNKN